MITVKDVADILNVKEKTVYAWAAAGYLPGHKLGKLWRFDQAEIETWLADRKHKPTDTDAIATQIIAPHPPDVDLHRIVDRAIASETQKAYTGRSGKPDRIKGLKKGGQHELN